jgi:hypothetical protein
MDARCEVGQHGVRTEAGSRDGRAIGFPAVEHGRTGATEVWVKPSKFAACLAMGVATLGVATLGGCSNPSNCTSEFHGGCVAGPPVVAPVNPAAVYYPSPAAAGPASVGLGDPATFADVDDKQCRSYGLVFGTHDYADCRIRLSAQHRGLDPNIGTTPPGPPSR